MCDIVTKIKLIKKSRISKSCRYLYDIIENINIKSLNNHNDDIIYYNDDTIYFLYDTINEILHCNSHHIFIPIQRLEKDKSYYDITDLLSNIMIKKFNLEIKLTMVTVDSYFTEILSRFI